MNYVQVEPSSEDGFLEIFSLVVENGDICYEAQVSPDKPATVLKDICHIFEQKAAMQSSSFRSG
jgi:hypothetical protein